MKLIVKKIGDDLVLVLPPELIQQLNWTHGDELNAIVEERDIRVMFAQSAHDRGLAIARKLMEDYKETLEALARS